MADAFNLQGNIKLDHKQVLDGLKKVDDQVQQTGKGMDEVENKSGKFGTVMSGVGKTIASAFSLHVIKDFTEECIKGANYQIQAETKLQNNLMATGKATQENVEDLKAYAGSMQKIGVIGDEVNMMGMAQLSTFNLSSESIKKLDKGMLDLAVNQKGVNATGEDMMGIANMVGKAMQGQATALTRVGVTMSEDQKKIIETGSEMDKASVIADVLQANYGNLNEEIAKTPEGKTQQLKNDLGDMKETLGMALLPLLQQVVEWIQKLVDWFTSLSPSMQKVVLVGGLLVALIPSLIGLFTGLATTAGALGIGISALCAPILITIGVIAGIIAVGVLLYKNWDTIKEKAGELGSWISEKWNGLKESTTNAWNNMKENTANAWNTMQGKIEEHGGGIKGFLGLCGEGMKASWSQAWNSMDNASGGTLGRMVDWIKGKVEDIKGFFSNLHIPEIKIPKIKMPHFKLNGEFSLKPPSVPSIGVDWYSTGGVFTKPTVLANGIGVGDKQNGKGNQAEVVSRYADLENWIEKVANRPINVYLSPREFARSTARDIKNELDNMQLRDVRYSY